MRSLIWILILAAAAVAFSQFAVNNVGYALLVTPQWRAEVSLNKLLALTLVAFLLFYILLHLLIIIMGLPARVQQHRQRRAREKASEALIDSIHRLFEGRYSQVIKAAERAWNSQFSPGLAALLALRAAHALRDETRIQLWHQRAMNVGAPIHVARLITEAEMALDRRDFSAAHQAMSQLTTSERRHIAALRLNLRVEQGLANWPQVLRMVQMLEKTKALTADQATALRSRAHREVMAQIADTEQLKKYWSALPSEARRDAGLLKKLVTVLIANDSKSEAARLLEEHLDTQWNSELIALYADCATTQDENCDGLIARAEAWLQHHPHDAQLLMTLGRLCSKRQLWGKAQSYLEASLTTSPSHRAHLELARLLDHLDKPTQADQHYRAAAHLDLTA